MCLILPSIPRKFWLLWPNFYFRYQVPALLVAYQTYTNLYIMWCLKILFRRLYTRRSEYVQYIKPRGIRLAHKQIHPRSIQNIDLNPRFSVFSLNILTGSFLGSRYLFLMENLGQSFLLASKEACKTKSNT